MIIGMPAETKEGEARVALMPDAVRILVGEGHSVRVQTGAGEGIDCTDADYEDAGATIVNAYDAWEVELVVKVKEMQGADLRVAPPGRTIFSFHHLPGEPNRTRALAARGDTAIAFEMVRNAQGIFPMLAPMSALAGRFAMDTTWKLLSAAPRKVVILGAGHAGMSAARAAARLRARVVLLTRGARSRDEALEQGFAAEIATPEAIASHVPEADMVIGAVFVPGEPTPKLLSRELVRRMQPGSVIADISIDAGGVSETSRPTTHQRPTYVDEGVIHYCVPNIPAAMPAQSAMALSGAALPYVRAMAREGIAEAMATSRSLREGVLVWKGQVTHEGIAAEAGLSYAPLVVESAA